MLQVKQQAADPTRNRLGPATKTRLRRRHRPRRHASMPTSSAASEKLAELFAESATEEHALRPVRCRRLDSYSVGR